MPYINQKRREQLLDGEHNIDTPGELNFGFTTLILGYVENNGLSYQTINDIVGALEGAKAEFQRRVVAPYEDQKIKENGDMYT